MTTRTIFFSAVILALLTGAVVLILALFKPTISVALPSRSLEASFPYADQNELWRALISLRSLLMQAGDNHGYHVEENPMSLWNPEKDKQFNGRTFWITRRGSTGVQETLGTIHLSEPSNGSLVLRIRAEKEYAGPGIFGYPFLGEEVRRFEAFVAEIERRLAQRR